MPKQLIYKLKIDGSYKPETLPMAKLSAYMADLAALLGEPNSVHFSTLEEGSAILAASVDTVAIPKVSQRVASIGRGEAPNDLRKAFDKLDKRLAADNAIGELTAFPDQEEGATVLEFPGRARTQSLDYGIIRQHSSLDGIPVSIGGQDKSAHVILEDRDHSYSGINMTRKLAKEIAPCLYSRVIRLRGTGSWWRDEDGQWQLKRFRAEGFEILDDASLREVVGQLRAIPGGSWDEMDDPTSFLNNLRNDPNERSH